MDAEFELQTRRCVHLAIVMDWIGTNDELIKVKVGENFDDFLDEFFKATVEYLFQDLSISLIDLQNSSSTTGSCGRVFSTGELIYHCSTCAIDETCVLCQECFQPSDHQGHKYKYYLSRGEGGSCDCGEHESWKSPLTCPIHLSTQEIPFEMSLQDSELLIDRISTSISTMELIIRSEGVIMPFKANPLDDWSDTDEEDKRQRIKSLVLVLENDEVHSFQDIIEMLNQILGYEAELGEQIARVVDERGFAPIKILRKDDGDFDNLPELLKSFERYRVNVYAKDPLVFHLQLASHGLIWSLEKLARTTFPLRNIILRLLAESNSLFSPHQTVIESVTVYDLFLWKEFRKKYQSLLILGLPFEFVKIEILRCFDKYIANLLNGFNFEYARRTSDLSFLHFSVQIFTVPSIARESCVRGFPKKACWMLGNQIKKWKIESEPIEPIVICVLTLKYIITDDSVKEQRLIVRDKEFFKSLGEAFHVVQRKFTKKRRRGNHVEYENPHIINEGNLGLSLVALINHLVETFLCFDDLCFAINVVQKFLMAKYSKSGPYNKDHCTFLQPNIWLLGALIRKFYRMKGEPGHLPVIQKDIVIDVLRSILAFSSVKVGEWVRNGIEATTLLSFINSGPVHGSIQYFYFVIHAAMAQGKFDIPFQGLFEPGDFIDREALVTVFVKTLICIFIGCTEFSQSDEEFFEMAISNALALGPIPFSQIEALVPVFISDHPKFEEYVERCASISGSTSLTSSYSYILKPSHGQHYRPFYWYLRESEREKAASYINQRFGIDKVKFMADKGHQLAFTGLNNTHENLPAIRNLLDLISHCFSHGCSAIRDDVCCFLAATHTSFPNVFSTWKMENSDAFELFQKEIDGVEALVPLKNIFLPDAGSSLKVKQQSNLRQLSAMKKEQAKQGILLAQSKFLENLNHLNSSSLEEESTVCEPSIATEFELAEMGACVVCQEEGNLPKNPLCALGMIELIPFTREDLNYTIVTCFHLIHRQCYVGIRPLQRRKCPLCRKLAPVIYPICHLPTNHRIEPFDLGRIVAEETNSISEPIPLENVPVTPPSTKELISWVRDKAIDIIHLIAQNCRQAFALKGCPERAAIKRTARMLKSYVLQKCLKNYVQKEKYLEMSLKEYMEEEDLQLTDDNWLPIITHSLLGWICEYSPLDGRPEVHQTLVRALRKLIRHQIAFHSGIELAEHFKYWMSIWFEIEEYEHFDTFKLICGGDEADYRHFLGQDYEPRDNGHQTLVSLTKLPSDYVEFFKLPAYCKCCTVRKGLTTWFICLFCGKHGCPNRNCDESFLAHQEICRRAGSTMYMMPTRCSVLLLGTDGPTCRIPAPYLDRHGETDFGFRSGGPLYLSPVRYEALRRIWASGGLTSYIVEIASLSSSEGTLEDVFSM